MSWTSEKEKMMRKYETLLFDVDDTLLDFGATESQALRRLFGYLGLELTDEVETCYKAYNLSLWKKLETGSITRRQLLSTRFPTFFRKYFSLEVDAEELTPKYMGFLAQGHAEVTGARQLLSSLKNAEHRLYVVSNGNLEVQRRRLADSGFRDYFDGVFISEKMGAKKPDKEFFDIVSENISGFDPETAVVIGDSLTSDIRGANNAGLDSIWFNPAGKRNETKSRPTYEVSSLSEINGLV